MKRIIAGAITVLLAVGCGAPERADEGPNGERRGADPAPGRGAVEQPVILFLGTSLTAGLGLDPEDAYPALIQRRIDSLDLGYRVVNAGLSGETSAGGLARLDWLLAQRVDVLVIELGGNDALRGQDPGALRRNLQEIIDRTREAYPDVRIVIAGMEAPPNLGERYVSEFRQVYRDLARENGAALIPFLLEGVGGVAELNQADGIHPTDRGQEIMAENVWRVLERAVSGER